MQSPPPLTFLKCAGFCCPIFESSVEHEARLAAARLETQPIPIWWHRRRVHSRSSSTISSNIHESRNSGNWNGFHTLERKNKRESPPFPTSWSVNNSGGIPDNIAEAVSQALTLDEVNELNEEELESGSATTDESSVFSTVSQEQRQRQQQQQQRDDFGNCRKHPQIKLAQRKAIDNESSKSNKDERKSRFSKLFSKSHKQGNINAHSESCNRNTQNEEWVILLPQCPECEREHVQKSRTRYHSKSKKSLTASATPQPCQGQPHTFPLNISYVPFPATLTIIENHPQLEKGVPALQIRTDPVPIEQTMHLSCAAANDDFGNWITPDGAFDFLIPCDSNENHLQPKELSPKYQIMERIIPLPSIDHVSRGGDAWDVLRQSTGLNDTGCNCDVKVHGFSDRLLRFDVVNFDIQTQVNGCSGVSHRSGHGRGYSFALVDFRSSISAIVKGAINNETQSYYFTGSDTRGESNNESYTPENVIDKLNSLVLWDRERREMGVNSWKNSLFSCMEECLSLGVTRNGVPASKRERGSSKNGDGIGRFDIL